jgi:hypothetical protein
MDRINDTSDKEAVIHKIVALEWDMFQAVNEGGPRASCQEDRVTFEGMRRGQFEAWPQETCESYLDDLLNALLDGRNLVTEKYIHMMKNTSPVQYNTLITKLPQPDEQISVLARQISDKLLDQTVELFKSFPYVSGSGRPLRSASDFNGVTSIETYQLGELLTYSEKTLRLLKENLLALEMDGRPMAREILANSVKHYGYKTLEEAEAATKARIEREGIRISFGCDNSDGSGCKYE